jgi:hypothetical protein
VSDLAQMYVTHLRQKRQHLANKRPPFAASREAQGCGIVRGEGPLTYAQTLYVQELEVYYETRLNPWKAEVAALEAEMRSLGVTLGDATVTSPRWPN